MFLFFEILIAAVATVPTPASQQTTAAATATVEQMHSIGKASDEPLMPGDIIFYWHELFVCGNPLGKRTATIRDIDPDRSPILRLDTQDPLLDTHQVQRIQVLQPNGTLINNPNPQFREIKEYRLKKSRPAPYRMSLNGERVARALG